MSRFARAVAALLFCYAPVSAAVADTAPLELRSPPVSPAQSVEDPFAEPEQAAPQTPAEADRSYIDAAGFRARFENRTVHLSLGRDHYGSEQYLPGDRTVWIFRDGRCQNGVWFYDAGQFCFSYGDDNLSCWRVFEAGGDLWAETADRLLTLRIYKIEREPLACAPEAISQAPPPPVGAR